MGVPVPEDETSRGYPATQKALVCGPKGEFVLEENYPICPLEEGRIIVKVAASPLNPVDTKMLGDFCVPGAIHGLDTAGTIVACGPNVSRGFKVGDRVAGCGEIMNKDRPLGGAFCQYVSLHSNLVLKVPDHLSLEEAAALGTPVASMATTIFLTLGMPGEWLDKPCPNPFPVLVYGGSTATGTMMINTLKV